MGKFILWFFLLITYKPSLAADYTMIAPEHYTDSAMPDQIVLEQPLGRYIHKAMVDEIRKNQFFVPSQYAESHSTQSFDKVVSRFKEETTRDQDLRFLISYTPTLTLQDSSNNYVLKLNAKITDRFDRTFGSDEVRVNIKLENKCFESPSNLPRLECIDEEIKGLSQKLALQLKNRLDKRRLIESQRKSDNILLDCTDSRKHSIYIPTLDDFNKYRNVLGRVSTSDSDDEFHRFDLAVEKTTAGCKLLVYRIVSKDKESEPSQYLSFTLTAKDNFKNFKNGAPQFTAKLDQVKFKNLKCEISERLRDWLKECELPENSIDLKPRRDTKAKTVH